MKLSLQNKRIRVPFVRQLTIVHRRWDARIWFKQVASLKDAGLLKYYEVADGQGDEVKDDVIIHDLGGLCGRGAWARLKWVYKALCNSSISNNEVLHFHDPSFLPAAIWLKLKGIKVVYDVHEDYPQQVLNWKLPFFIRFGASLFYNVLEYIGGRCFDRIIAATPSIAKKFPKEKTVVVQNYPLKDELVRVDSPNSYQSRKNNVIYIGGISELRGIQEMIRAVDLIPDHYNARLILGGSFSPSKLESEVTSEPGWHKTDYLGWLDREQVANVLNSARIGLVLIYPEPRYVVSLPTKMFEYMSAGIPVIASNFPLWKEIVDGSGCGVTVNPLEPKAIADAVQCLFDHPEEAEAMGRRGREAVEQKYNWDMEAEKLINLYEMITLKRQCVN